MSYTIPQKRILSKEDLEEFQSSDAYNDFIGFIERLNESVKGLKIDSEIQVSPSVEKVLTLLESLLKVKSEIPPVDNALSRFGNPAFVTFYDKAAEMIPELLEPIISKEAIPEVSAYLVESFGNRRRIDYGTGHEANFIAFLLCLEKLGVVGSDDYKAAVLRIFVKYMSLMRELQFSYWLEPAGSHGVWGLDDYHFLPFMFGSAQLIDHKYIRPKSIHDLDIVEQFSKSYMYLGCIAFINSVKNTASLRWHSPMLDDISAAKSWAKVNAGMIKMYKAEVLNKLPIMQHFMFGSLIKFDGGSIVENDDNGCGHHHHHGVEVNKDGDEVYAMGQEYPDCCGIPIPSAIAAAAAGQNRRPIPFD
ncbi:Phosphotyrosyl phosphatase activator [Umbelopsis sp. PMI_123]|nr:Phosphotyrosyl phosphatase activator [Umbelopsis sp. PMI_123]